MSDVKPKKGKAAAAAAASEKSGVGQLVVEKKAKKGGAKRKVKADESDSDDDSDDEGSKKKKKKAKGANGSPAKRGASNVDASKGHLTHQEQRHEAYMECKVADLQLYLNANNIAAPKPPNKSNLAWQCVYGEVMGAPADLCERCGKGKLKPKLKKDEFGVISVKKGETKWTCPGYWDAEADAIAFCNKAYTDAEVKTVKFKGVGQLTDADVSAVENRKAEAAAQREEAKQHRAEQGLDEQQQEDSTQDGEPKKRKFVHAPRVTKKEDESHDGQSQGDAASTADESAQSHADDAPAPQIISADDDMAAGFVSGPESPAAAAAAAGASSAGSPSQKKPTAAARKAQDASKRAEQAAEEAAEAADVAAALSGEGERKTAKAAKDGSKPPCQFGSRCYRKNPEHLAEYSHPK